jgi:hypothetical protein
MKRFRAWLPLLTLFVAIIAVQGIVMIVAVPDSRDAVLQLPVDDDSGSWSGIVRDDGPLMERIPAPYVVLPILGGACVTAIGWYFLVRWTDISEAW